MRTLLIAVGLGACVALAPAAPAQDGGQKPLGDPGCCADCRCHVPCQAKVCQVECGVEKVKKSCWCVECEDFCPPLPTLRRLCPCACGDPGCGGGCQAGGASCPSCGGAGCRVCAIGTRPNPVVPPTCGPVRTKKKLVKKEYECEVPVYKCVVRYLCADCCNGGCTVPGRGSCGGGAGGCESCAPEPPVDKPQAPAPGQQAWDAAPLPPL